ncbi:hypothetical protein CRE_09171 [Caenorhabditis remanei]|uniref:NR LBD domain-containing protein n=1 Tax=Caenorhabditis remanei TaxID=31234 RepID=E3LHA6_CAERE|nr:hypothetical protein CRE_09171 [Caenorhabditis remanei]
MEITLVSPAVAPAQRFSDFQYNRDAMLAESTSSITPSISYFVGRPEFLLFCDSGMSTHFTPKNVLDVQYLISEASRLLNQGCESPIFAENQLKKLTIGFNFVRLDTENVKTFEKVGQTEFMDVIEYYFLTTTKWILHFEEFQKLDRSIQVRLSLLLASTHLMTLVQTIWYVWIKIHKCVSTIAYRKAHPNVCSTYKVLRNHVLDRKKGGLDTSWISDFPEEYVSKYMLSQHMYDFDIMNIIEQLDLSDVELTYMFAQICFEYAGKRFPGEIQNITDHFQQILSNDLHEFYVTDQRRNRYSHRLNELMKVNSLIQVSSK